MITQELVENLRELRRTATDVAAVKCKELYPQSIGEAVTQDMIDKGNNRFLWDGRLYKVPRPINQILDNWTPDLAPALYEAIDPEHAGTAEDPHFVRNMKVLKDQYYLYNAVLYLCIRDSGITLQDTPDKLIDHYFKIAESVENTEMEG